MKNGEPSFVIEVDVKNPGQFFACCGILELSHRLWRSSYASGSFSESGSQFHVFVDRQTANVEDLWYALSDCELATLSVDERNERDALEKRKRELRRSDETLPPAEESRRVELGKLAREGPVRIGNPFNLTLNWWEADDAPKTWAGLQEIHKIARASQQAISDVVTDPNSNERVSLSTPRVVLRKTSEYCNTDANQDDKVEPFFFDARRFCDALKTGYSLDEQEFETVAFPVVELLSLIGLQRFRPIINEDGEFCYSVWHRPLTVDVAASIAATIGIVPATRPYRFAFAYRDGQHRYKSFQFSKEFMQPEAI